MPSEGGGKDGVSFPAAGNGEKLLIFSCQQVHVVPADDHQPQGGMGRQGLGGRDIGDDAGAFPGDLVAQGAERLCRDGICLVGVMGAYDEKAHGGSPFRMAL